MSSLSDNKFIPERRAALTRYDQSDLFGYDYSKDVLTRSISTRPMTANPRLSNFLHSIQKMLSDLVDSGYSIRNFYDISVDKNYTKHTS